MKTANILLRSISDVKEFVNIMNKCEYDVDLVSGRYIVDAKSILGIFSLDLAKPIVANIHCDACDDLLEEIKKFEV